jgi:hypothetical protein
LGFLCQVLNLTIRSQLPSSQKYDWVKPDNDIPTLPSSQRYDWVKPDNEIPTLPSSQKYDWVKHDNDIPNLLILLTRGEGWDFIVKV